MFKKAVIAIIPATLWIGLSEFLRNELLLKSHWTDHYQELGLVFPSAPVNNAAWGLWSLFLAVLIYLLIRKFTLWQTTLLGWYAGFVFMWVVLWNLNVLPSGLLIFAVPLSLLETFVAAWIIRKLS